MPRVTDTNTKPSLPPHTECVRYLPMRVQQTQPARAGARPPGAAAEEKRYGKVYDARVIRRLWPLWPLCQPPAPGHSLYARGYRLVICLPHIWSSSVWIAISHEQPGRADGPRLLYASNAGVGWIMQYRQALVLERVAQRLLLDLRQALFTHLMRLDLSFYDRNAIGRLMSRVQNDVAICKIF